MGSSMFSLSRAAKLSITNNPEIIRKLTEIRISGYKLSLMNQLLAEQDYQLIHILIKELGEKILKVNFINVEGTDAFNVAREKFKTLLDVLLQHNKFSLVSYAAQLLQFYTVLCDDNFIPKSTLSSVNKFLADNKDKVGNCENNLFITEYILITIYNELVSSVEAHAEADEDMKSRDGKMRLGHLTLTSKELTTIKEHLDTWSVDAPDNQFVIYLEFVYQYTIAKLLEFQYEMQSEQLNDEKSLQLTSTQNTHLNLAKEALDKICAINEFNNDIETKIYNGLEFSLGQDPLSKFPETNIDELKKHLLSLQSINSDKTEVQ